MKILVLGGAGYIGSHLVKILVRDHSNIVNVFDVKQNHEIIKNVNYFKGDFSNIDLLELAIQDVDFVYHLIGSPSPRKAFNSLVPDINLYLINTIRLLDLMVMKKINRILFVSSGGTIYGNASGHKVSETIYPQPISSYGVLQLTIENYINLYGAQTNIQPLIYRVSNLYGHGFKQVGVQGVINTFLSNINENKPISIWGDGSNIRDYIYIDDLIEAMFKSLHLDVRGVFNIGSGEGYSLLDIRDICFKCSGSVVKTEFLSHNKLDVKRNILDINKAIINLDWKPKYSIQEGISKCWNEIYRR